MLYRGAARKVILGLKHGDRLDMVKPLAGWMATAGRPLLAETDLIAPVPLHWRRLLRRATLPRLRRGSRRCRASRRSSIC